MKTLIICAQYTNDLICSDEELNIYTHVAHYKQVELFGQHPDHDNGKVVYIRQLDNLFESSYNDLQETARQAYAKYFNCSLNNIISMEYLNEL